MGQKTENEVFHKRKVKNDALSHIGTKGGRTGR